MHQWQVPDLTAQLLPMLPNTQTQSGMGGGLELLFQRSEPQAGPLV